MESGGTIDEARRERIPEDVRTFVWRRDGARCVRCGSTQSLEFDHSIPVSKGGSNTSKNVQLLCAECNRKKRDHIYAMRRTARARFNAMPTGGGQDLSLAPFLCGQAATPIPRTRIARLARASSARTSLAGRESGRPGR